jgi:hypothetical protein
MMTLQKALPHHLIPGALALALALTTFAPSAKANVYATNFKINGGTTNISVQPGTNVSISYLLNEPASAGVIIKVLAGATTVRTISLAGGSAGTTRGTNTVVWNGKDNSSNNVPGGNYSISITAASSGYNGWTVITDDNNGGNYSWEARGIAVDRNTNSPYYGRVFVGNSEDHSNGSTSTNYGDYLGIQKLNADGSYADEGGFSDGGVAWRGTRSAPWRIRVSDDDKVYVMDVYGYGDVYRFDPVISTNSMLHVLRTDNDGTHDLSGIAVVGTGANTQIWMADKSYLGSAGILKYAVTADGTCATNDTGTTVVGIGGSLDIAPYAVALDKSGNIYCVQSPDQGDPSHVFRFPAYDPGTNSGIPLTNADWIVPASDDTARAHGIAVDPTGTYVAACFWGFGPSPYIDGNIKIYYATNGTVVTNFDLGVSYPNKHTSQNGIDPTQHMDTDADWDAVGNLYYLDDLGIVWRAVSPPGANQATTVTLAAVQVIGAVQPPHITSIGAAASTVTIHFTGGSSDSAGVFLLLSAPVVTGPYAPAAGAIITGSGGTFQAIVPMNGPRQFYRVERLAAFPLHIANLRVAAGTVTINFTGAPSDSYAAFTLLSSAAVNGAYTDAGATITGSGGAFQATVPINGPRQFYRIRK